VSSIKAKTTQRVKSVNLACMGT